MVKDFPKARIVVGVDMHIKKESVSVSVLCGNKYFCTVLWSQTFNHLPCKKQIECAEMMAEKFGAEYIIAEDVSIMRNLVASNSTKCRWGLVSCNRPRIARRVEIERMIAEHRMLFAPITDTLQAEIRLFDYAKNSHDLFDSLSVGQEALRKVVPDSEIIRIPGL